MVMLWLEGGQGEVRGACAPPPPQHPKSPHLDPPPPNPPSRSPPPPPEPLLDPPSNAPPPPPPPQGASGQQLVGGVVGVQNRGVAPPGWAVVSFNLIGPAQHTKQVLIAISTRAEHNETTLQKRRRCLRCISRLPLVLPRSSIEQSHAKY